MADTAFQTDAFQSDSFQIYGGVTATSCDITIAVIQDSDTVSLTLGLPFAGGAGKSPGTARNYRKRYLIEVDGETFEVRSEEEARYLLEKVLETAQAKAHEVIQRAQKAQRRPKRKVLSDARRALVPPEITVNRWAENLVPNISSEIEDIYQDALKTIEIGLFLRIREELDDEEAILLLI